MSSNLSLDGREWQRVENNIHFLPANPEAEKSIDCYRASVKHSHIASHVYCDSLEEARLMRDMMHKYKFLVHLTRYQIRAVVDAIKEHENNCTGEVE